MKLIICVDDDMGMMFNNRRQSQDSVLREHILHKIGNSRLWMNHYSAKQFDGKPQINVDENFISEAANGDFCFVENTDITPYEQWIEQIVLYRWNRRYPADFHFNVDLSAWRLIETNEFPGSSHEKITEEVYER